VLAVDSATNNTKLNDLSDKFTCTICEMDGAIPHEIIDARMSEGQYDVMIANILLPPLLALVHRLSTAVRPGGKLCLSGVQLRSFPSA
jgi:ribosomal protein L11 methylase PrmA